MPNIKRRFKDDDPSSDEDVEDNEPTFSGKRLRMPGGKGFGKQLRPPTQQQDEDSEDSDDDDEQESEPQQPVYRQGGGKQLRHPSGKALRPPQQDDDSDDDDEDLDESARPIQRSGGKTLLRMRAPEEDEDDSDEDIDDDEEVESPPQRVVQRGGGGKSLSRMQESHQRDNDSDEESSEDKEPTAVIQRGGGKTLSQMSRPSRGKQLRPPGRGKQLRPPSNTAEDASDEEDRPVRRGGGKSLMSMQAPPEENSDEDEYDEEAKPPKRVVHAARPSGGKILRHPGGGKMLRRPTHDDEEEEPAAPDKEDSSDDEMDMDDSDEEEERKRAPVKKAPVKRRPGRPRKTAAAYTAPAEESNDESSDEEAEFDMETFDPQKLVKDEEDQKYLDSLPEFEREAILGERFEKRKADMDMKKALRDAKRKEREERTVKGQKGTKKRKAAANNKSVPAKKKKSVDDDDAALAKSLASKRESSRNRDATGAKAKKAEALAALREERKKNTRKGYSDSESSFGDDDDDSDDDYEESGVVKPWQRKAAETKKSRLDQVEDSDEEMGQAGVEDDDDDKYGEETQHQRIVQEAELADYLKITVSRRKLGRWCNEPYFKKSVVGCFVKLFIGENELGKRCYRLCRIVDIQQNANGSYSLPPVKKEKPVMTDKMLKLQFGKNERIFPIRLISDNKADESDVSLYVTEMKNQRQQVLSRNEANKIHRKQDELVKNYTYTTEDIENNLRNRKKKGQTAANLGLEQTRAAIAVQVARATLKDTKHQAESGEGDSSAIVEAEKLLQERLDEESLVLKKVKSRKDRLTQRGKDKKWAKVNQRALEMNQKLDRGALKDKDSEKKDKESGAKPKFNPYARRKVKPKILWEVGQKEDKEEETKEAEAPKEGGKQKEQDATPNLVQEHQEKAAALSQSHQFAIDEEILAQSSFTNGITGLSTKKPVRKRVRKGLSLNQYLKQKSAGTL